MPRSKSSALTGTAELNATIERVAPDILALLADGTLRTKAAIVEALAGRHDKRDVVHALIRLAVTGQAEENGGRYALAAAIRAGAGRDCAGLDGLIDGGDRRIAEMEAEQLESLAGDR